MSNSVRNAGIIAAYESGMTMAASGELYGLSCGATGDVLKRAGVQTRPVGRMPSLETQTPLNDTEQRNAVRAAAAEGSMKLHAAIVAYFKRHHPESDVARLAA